MTVELVIAIAIVCLAVGLLAGFWLPPHNRSLARRHAQSGRRILLPITDGAVSRRAFEAAVRLAKADDETIVPAFLARVPRQLPLESRATAASTEDTPLLREIEHHATAQGVAVDVRVARGRTYRDALNRLLDDEEFDRIIISATANPRSGLSGEDLQWLLKRAPAEVIILRPAPEDTRRISAV